MANEYIADGIYHVSGFDTTLKNGAWVSDAGTYLVTGQAKLASIPNANPGDIAFTAGYTQIWQLDTDGTTWVELPKTAATTAAAAAAQSASDAEASAAAATAVKNSIPQDYTTLSNDMADLKSAYDYLDSVSVGKNLIGNEAGVLYPCYIPAGTPYVNVCTSDGSNFSPVPSSATLKLICYGANKQAVDTGWTLPGSVAYKDCNFSAYYSSQDIYYLSINVANAVPLMVSVQNAAVNGTVTYTPYFLNTERLNSKVDNVESYITEAISLSTGNASVGFAKQGVYYYTPAKNSDPIDIYNFQTSPNFECVMIPCEPGDVFTVYGKGEANGRLWAFTKSDYVVIDRETDATNIVKRVLVAPPNTAYLFVNNNKTTAPDGYVIRGELIKDRIVRGTSELLFDIIKDSWVNGSGEIVNSTTDGWDRTDYIPIDRYAVIYAKSSVSSNYNIFYDEEYNKIGSNFVIGTEYTRIPVRPGAKYMILSNRADGVANLHVMTASIPEAKKIAEIIPYYDTNNTQITLDVSISNGTVSASMVFPANWGIKIDQNHEAIYFNSDVSTTVEKTSSSRAWTVFFNASTNTFSMQTAFGRNLQLIGDDDYELFSFYYDPSANELTVNRYSQLIRNAISYNDKTVEALNEDKIPYIVNAKRQENDWIHDVDYPEAVTMAVMTDIHGNNRNFLRYLSFCKTYANYITEKVCLGDMVASWYGDDITYWDNNPDGADILRTIGNHDVWQANVRPFANDVQADVYNTYFHEKTSAWNITQPANADTNHLMYYYKDYADQKLRLIVLDCMYWDSAENTWFAGVLADALTNGYGVVCTSHYNLSKTGVTGIGNFYSLDYGFAGLTIGTGGQDARDAVDTFISNGGTFICWMSGDAHYDDCGIYENNGRKQITLTFENASLNSDWNDSLRVKGTKTQDSFNLVSFDTNKKLIKIVRIGNNVDRYYRPKNFMTINYETHQVVANG